MMYYVIMYIFKAQTLSFDNCVNVLISNNSVLMSLSMSLFYSIHPQIQSTHAYVVEMLPSGASTHTYVFPLDDSGMIWHIFWIIERILLRVK